MDIKTHKLANKSLLGTPISVIEGESAIVELVIDDSMVVDDKGLVHGGFAFGSRIVGGWLHLICHLLLTASLPPLPTFCVTDKLCQ